MNPLQKIKQGIIEQDWSLVVDGYESMTGDSINTTEQKPQVKKKRGRKPAVKKEIVKVEAEEEGMVDGDIVVTKVNGIQFICEPENEELKQLNKAVSKLSGPKSKRSGSKNTKPCPNCGEKFNHARFVNKVSFDSNSTQQEVKCPKCRKFFVV